MRRSALERKVVATLLAAFSCVVVAAPAAADEDGLKVNYALDGAVTVGAGGLWIASELLKPQLAPTTCHWCSVPGIDDSVRSALRIRDTHAADSASNAIGFIAAPLVDIGLTALGAQADGRLENAPADGLLIAESAVLAADLNQLTKYLVGRERPFVHALAPGDKGQTAQPADNNMSFFSGHTTFVFSVAAASGTVASLRGYKAAPAIWGIGMSLAFLTGYLRMAADKHYFTDVATGAAVGSAVGVLVPLLHRHKLPVEVAPLTVRGQLSGISLSGAF